MAFSSVMLQLWSMMTSNPVRSLAILGFSLTVAWIIYTKLLHPLADVPGPFLASITRLWYIKKVREGSFNQLARELHRQYGPLVRMTPGEVSVSDPEAIKILYSVKSNFAKTEFYSAFRSHGFDTRHPDLFTTLDEESHSRRRKIFNNIYSMSSILDSEPYIDSCTELFVRRLREYADSQEQVDLGRWLRMYAFDVIGELFFGKQLGFMETRSDYGNYISSNDTLLPVLCTASLLPVGLRTVFLMSGLIFPSIRKALPLITDIDSAAKEHVRKRQDELEDIHSNENRRDVLAKLFTIQREKGDVEDFKIADIQQEAYVALVAGSDTTAIALCSILYQLIRNPEAYEKVTREIDEAVEQGKLTFPARYVDATKLKYLTACCKEGMRLHPSVGLILPRHVPAGGCEIAGRRFAEGTRLGVNPSVIHYDTTIFGSDADKFNPDRWLKQDAANMDRYMLQFGQGSRTCIGKNIAFAEMHKLLPQLLRFFTFELVHPEWALETKDYWFNKQSGFLVRINKR